MEILILESGIQLGKGYTDIHTDEVKLTGEGGRDGVCKTSLCSSGCW